MEGIAIQQRSTVIKKRANRLFNLFTC